jgi:MoaA/NifB/PqqE/SkfB family radical SAM enzyme
MQTAYYAIGLRCNLRCVFCPCSEEQPEYKSFSTEELKETIEDTLKVKNIENFLLSGGEPTIQKNFLPIVKYICREKKYPLSLLTNAVAFKNPRFLRRFLEAVGDSRLEIVTAIHSHLAKKHNSLTQAPHSFERSISGLQNCVAAGINTSIKFNIVRYNYKDLPAYIEYMYQTFPDEVALILCNIDLSGYAAKNKDLIPVKFEESTPYLEEALDRVIEFRNQGRKRNVRVFTTPLCVLDPYYWFFVNKSTKDEVAAYRSPDVKEEKNKLMFDFPSGSGTIAKKCDGCGVEEICPGCWDTYINYYGSDFLKPIH